MGLDITAYKNLQIVENPTLDEYGDLENWETEWCPGESMSWSETHFKGRAEGVMADKVYTWEDRFDFRAGSYSSYNIWRRKLQEFANQDLFKITTDGMGNVGLECIDTALIDSDSFYELIEFADNEGVIGSVVSKKLLSDFIKNKSKAKEFSKTFEEGNNWFYLYCDWLKAFEYASENGAIDFH